MAAATATTGKQPDSKKKGKGQWKTAVEKELAEAIELGVRSSTKSETREFRVLFYLEQLTKAKLQVGFYEEMLRLEEQKESAAQRRVSKWDADLDEAIRQLTLQGQADQLRGDLGEQIRRLQERIEKVRGGEGGETTKEESDDDETVVLDSSGCVK
jgi:hypothetical protein